MRAKTDKQMKAMKYSINILQAEIVRLEDNIKFFKTQLRNWGGDKNKIKARTEEAIKHYKAQITELKADIKKLK